MGWRDSQASTPVEKIENIENMKKEGHKFDKFDRDGIVKTETTYCDFTKIDVPKGECHKPLSCFYRNEDDKPVECQHLKTFVKQRNVELGI